MTLNQKRNNVNFQTAEWVCDLMVSLIPSSCIAVLEPTPGRGNLIKSLKKRGGFVITAPKDFGN